jgi:hypothetical protein
MVTFNEEHALEWPLFEGDFGAPGDRELSDVIRTARKARTCCECLEPITPGMRYRYHSGIYDGQLRTYTFCDGCCKAMAQTFHGNYNAMDARSAVRSVNLAKREGKDIRT